jgi:hypothetical protein
MVDGLQMPILNRTKKPLAIALSEVGWGGDNGGDVTNIQHKSNQNCHYESPLYKEYILIKNLSQQTQCTPVGCTLDCTLRCPGSKIPLFFL